MKRVLVISLAVVLALCLSMVPVPANKVMAADVSPGESIQNAIDSASYGDIIYVAAGTYYENITLKSGVEVVGDGPGDTTISGTGGAVVIANSRIDAKLDGFTITGGSGTQSGAGIAIQFDSSNVTISNCVITGNTADFVGGGIAILQSSATIVDCTIVGNTAKRISTFGGSGGGIYNNGTLTVNNCTIYDNTAEIAGGGVRNNEGTLTVNNTIIYNNTAYFKGGGLNNIGGTVTLKNSTISKNTSTGTWLPQPEALSGGGGISTDSPVTLINSIVNGNTATAGGDITAEGGGIRVGGPKGKLTILNSTIVNNTAKTSGGAIRGGPTTVTNSILWGNSAPQFEGSPTISYSLVEDGYLGIGNISGDPQFVDADGADDIVGTLDDDLHLQATSPCIDAGDNSAPNLPDTDKDGNDRKINGTVDMGAYEYQLTNSPPVADAGPDQTVEQTSYEGAEVTLNGTASSDPDDDPLTFSWSAQDISFDDATSSTPTATFPLGTTTVTLMVNDGTVDSDPDTMMVAVLSLHSIKTQAILELESLLPTGEKKVDKKIEKAIEHLEKALDEALWLDDTHLDEKHGAKVFNEEKKTVKELKHLLDKDDTPEDVKDVCQSVINKLIEVDKLLATTAYEEAQSGAGYPKVDKELEKCDKELEKAEEELAKGKYDKAIKHYKNAWKHAQKALRKAPEDDE